MEEKRINSGYEIIESHTIGSNELVIGHNDKAPNPYVCWYCKNGSDYFWGYYCNLIPTKQPCFFCYGFHFHKVVL